MQHLMDAGTSRQELPEEPREARRRDDQGTPRKCELAAGASFDFDSEMYVSVSSLEFNVPQEVMPSAGDLPKERLRPLSRKAHEGLSPKLQKSSAVTDCVEGAMRQDERTESYFG